MILVDIGNSGLRAATSSCEHPIDSDGGWAKIQSPVLKLSWSSIGQQIGKQRPDPSHSENRRWIQIDDDQGYDWLVHQTTSLPHRNGDANFRIASVNRNALDRLLRAIDKHSKKSGESIVTQVVDYTDVGIELQVERPEKVGIDRILAARAAVAWNTRRMKANSQDNPATPVIVVQAGTALTVDWVDQHGCFQGGSILPGVGLALQYLAAGTDQLPWLPTDSIDRLPRLPGKNTEEAIAAGVHASLVGGVRYLVQRYRKEIGGKARVPVVISGGDGRLVREHIAAPASYVENLVLVGLALSGKP
jgi:type III pantothenate kinase